VPAQALSNRIAASAKKTIALLSPVVRGVMRCSVTGFIKGT
jgi:hypothetical protein